MSKESQHKNSVEILAQYLAGGLEKEDMSTPNKNRLERNLNLMSSDPEFASEVNTRKNLLLLDGGRKTNLFTDEQIRGIKKRRKLPKNLNRQAARQPKLFETIESETNSSVTSEDFFDSERGIFRQGIIFESRYGQKQKHSPVNEEIIWKKDQLRNRIGLPVARGNSPYVNDPSYQRLVRVVYRDDSFGIFKEYDRVTAKVPAELASKIKEVEEIVSDILGSGYGLRKKYEKLNQELREYKNRWNIS